MRFQAGVARIIITPPVGLELAGWGFGPSAGVLDELEAQALVIESDGEQAAIVTADLLGLGGEVVRNVRQRVEAALGIPARNVMLSASHTHSGPASAFYRVWGALDTGYVRNLEAQLAGLVGMARRNLQGASLGAGLGCAPGLGANRRHAGAVTDPAVPVIRVDSADGRMLSVLWNYACHPVSLHSYKNLISPDYPGYARAAIRAVLEPMLGADVMAQFTLGAAGDINPASFAWQANTPRRSWEMGAALGCEVAKTALGVVMNSAPVVRVAQSSVELPLEPLPGPDQVRAIRDRAATRAAELQRQGRPWDEVAVPLVDRDWAEEALRELESGRVQRAQPCEIQAIRLGDAVLMALPLEVFAETGLAIKGAAPARVTVLSTNSNGTLGYLPTLDAYAGEDYTNPRGNAPKVYGLYAFAPGAEPAVRQAVTGIIAGVFA